MVKKELVLLSVILLLTFAYPFITLSNDSAFLNNLSKIIEEKKINKIILGLPSDRFKSSKELSQKVRKLKSEIETKNKIEVSSCGMKSFLRQLQKKK